MRLYLILFIAISLPNSCSLIGAIGHGRSLSKAENKDPYLHPIHKSLYEFNRHSVSVENLLLQLLVDNKISFKFYGMGNTVTDGILITLPDIKGNRYTYDVSCVPSKIYMYSIDTLLIKTNFSPKHYSWLDISSVTDSNRNIVNIYKSNKRFPRSLLHFTVDSLFNNAIAEPLTAMVNKHKNCDKMMVKVYPDNIYRVLITDSCTKKTISVFTYQKDTSIRFSRHSFYNPLKTEKFYSRFTLIDSLNRSGYRSKYLVEPQGTVKKIY